MLYPVQDKATRNNGALLCIPKVKLKLAKSVFFSMGVKIFNTLPNEIRRTEHFLTLEIG
jgi:hypothetical protein